HARRGRECGAVAVLAGSERRHRTIDRRRRRRGDVMARSHRADPVRTWIRLLMCSHMIESQVRGRLREEFATTLPRFDVLAQLERTFRAEPRGLTMGELSRRLMVSNGNLTGLTARLLREKLVERVPSPDRRTQRVRLTPSGKRAFDRMAAAHRS